MDFILIYIFNDSKKEDKFFKLIDQNENVLRKYQDYDKFLFSFFKKEKINENLTMLYNEISTECIKEFKNFVDNDEDDEKYLIFTFNIEKQIDEKDLEQYESFLELEKNLYNLLNYKSEESNTKELTKHLYKKQNTEFKQKKIYNLIINTEKKNINRFKVLLKNDKINEKIYFNTNFNSSIKMIIKESKEILFT